MSWLKSNDKEQIAVFHTHLTSSSPYHLSNETIHRFLDVLLQVMYPLVGAAILLQVMIGKNAATTPCDYVLLAHI